MEVDADADIDQGQDWPRAPLLIRVTGASARSEPLHEALRRIAAHGEWSPCWSP